MRLEEFHKKHELPYDWQLAHLSELIKPGSPLCYGVVQPGEDVDSGNFLIRVCDLSQETVQFGKLRRISAEVDAQYKRSRVYGGELLVSLVGTIGRLAVVPNSLSGANIARAIARLNLADEISTEWVSNWLRSPVMQDWFLRSSREVARKTLNLNTLGTAPILLPPLNEQRRIVAKIEGLTARSRKAREALNAIPPLLDQFRQSVLAAAFRGDLTADWRAANPDVEPAEKLLERIRVDQTGNKSNLCARVIPKTWVWCEFSNIANIESNLVDPAEYPNSPHIAPNHIVSDTGELLEYSTILKDGVISPKHLFYPGQIIYSKIRPYLAKAIVVDFLGLCSADMYPIKSLINVNYLHLWMISPEFTQLVSRQQGRTVLPKINQKALNKIPVPIPPIKEQNEIVERFNSRLDSFRLLSSILEESLKGITEMDQSIIAQAFRGELVPQDPNDEPASVLLDRIRAEREKAQKPEKVAKGKKNNPL